MTDFIGDIHGHVDELNQLLIKLGYEHKNGSFCHPERKVLFVGDYIDRGPKIKETLEIVKSMVDSGNAIALMGNHEYNAICFHYEEKAKGGHLRKHSIKNILQHCKTLYAFKHDQEESDYYIDWFKTLPLWYETDEFRAVHACWDENHINYLKTIMPNARLTDSFILQSVIEGTTFNHAIEEVLKGKELAMPLGEFFEDKYGTKRTEFRAKFWIDPKVSTYYQMSLFPLESLPHEQMDTSKLKSDYHYAEHEKPLFFGHYWFEGKPSVIRHNICCLDYSVANKGHLVAYRFDGEGELDSGKLVWV
jgi:hypothetical protein